MACLSIAGEICDVEEKMIPPTPRMLRAGPGVAGLGVPSLLRFCAERGASGVEEPIALLRGFFAGDCVAWLERELDSFCFSPELLLRYIEGFAKLL